MVPLQNPSHKWQYEGRSKSSNLRLESRAVAEYFCCGNILSLSNKLEKPIQISVLNYVHANLKGSATNLKMAKQSLADKVKVSAKERYDAQGNP